MNNTINSVNVGHTPAIEPDVNITRASQNGAITGGSTAATESFFYSIQKAYSDSKHGELKTGNGSGGNNVPIFNQSSDTPAKNGRPDPLRPDVFNGFNATSLNESALSVSVESASKGKAHPLNTDYNNIDKAETGHLSLQLNSNSNVSDNQKSVLPQRGQATAQEKESDIKPIGSGILNGPNQSSKTLTLKTEQAESNVDKHQLTQQSERNLNDKNNQLSQGRAHTTAVDGGIAAINLARVNTQNQSANTSVLNSDMTSNASRDNSSSIVKHQERSVDSPAINTELSGIKVEKQQLNPQSEFASQLDNTKYRTDTSRGLSGNIESITTKSSEALVNDAVLADLPAEKTKLTQYTELPTKTGNSKIQVDDFRVTSDNSETLSTAKNNKLSQLTESLALNTEQPELTAEKIHLAKQSGLDNNADVRKYLSVDHHMALRNLDTVNSASVNNVVQNYDLTSMHTEQLELMSGKNPFLPDALKQQNMPNMHKLLLSQVTPEHGAANIEGIALNSNTLTNILSTANVNSIPQGEIAEAFGKPVWNQGMGKQILWMVNQNISSAEIRLNPANLGPIEVLIDMSEDDISVSLTSRHAVVREAMEQALPKLREMLDENGFNLADTDISKHSFFEQREQSADDKNNFLNNHGEKTITTEMNEPELHQTSLSTGLVDYYI
jgi:flagellar hook-length control protein FliK